MVEIGFNPQEYEVPSGIGEPLRPDWYTCKIDKVDLKATKDGQGSYLEFQFAVDENAHPDCAGRMVWDRLNVFNKSEKTQKWARGTLRKIQECVGRPTSTNTDDLVLRAAVREGGRLLWRRYGRRHRHL